MLDSLNSKELSLLDPIHQFPRASTLVHDFSNFVVKVGSLDVFDSRLEFFPVFKGLFAIVGPLMFGVLGNF